MSAQIVTRYIQVRRHGNHKVAFYFIEALFVKDGSYAYVPEKKQCLFALDSRRAMYLSYEIRSCCALEVHNLRSIRVSCPGADLVPSMFVATVASLKAADCACSSFDVVLLLTVRTMFAFMCC